MNYISTLLAGRISLPRTFWLFGVPSYIAFILVTPTGSATPDKVGFWATGYLLVFVIVFVNAFLLLISVGIWRSATNYQGLALWKYGAKVYAAWAGLSTVVLLLAVALMPLHWIFTTLH
jgi:hypothetical protein